MDPVTALGVVSAALQLADTCIKITNFIRNAQKTAKEVIGDLAVIGRDVETMRNISHLTKDTIEGIQDSHDRFPPVAQQSLELCASGILGVVEETSEPLGRLEQILESFLVREKVEFSNRLQALKAISHIHRKKDEIRKIHGEILAGLRQLQSYYCVLNFVHQHQSGKVTDASFNDLSQNVQSLSSQMKTLVPQMLSLVTTQPQIVTHDDRAAEPLPGSVGFNRHVVGLPPQTFYTGREDLLTNLKEAFDQPCADDGQFQRRFVVYGFPGSGKSEFCNKFANKYKQFYWGIFVIDASSDKSAEISFCTIARKAAAGETHEDFNAAKQWLAERTDPWLLIIDNADHLELDIKKYFPSGNAGCVLINTRNSSLRSEGNVGKRFYNFEALEKDAARTVLLSAACEKDDSLDKRRVADKISDELQCLPLALVHAGNTILQKFCTWKEYIGWYRDTQRNYSRRNSLSPETSQDDRIKLTLIPTFEPFLERLEHSKDKTSIDAFELIHTLGYFHHNNITSDILKKVVINADKDGLAKDEDLLDMSPRSKSLRQRVEEVGEKVLRSSFFAAQPVLPSALKSRNAEVRKKNIRRFDDSASSTKSCEASPVEPPSAISTSPTEERSSLDRYRLRDALRLLESMSLIRSYEENQEMIYSLHPIVHSWVRERIPKIWQRAIWCEAATQALTQCIVLEEKAFSGETPTFFDPGQLLPHVNSVSKCQAKIDAAFVRHREKRRILSWPPVFVPDRPLVARIDDAVRLTKFSLVYKLGGEYNKAAALQEEVRNRAKRRLGMNHEKSIYISLALAGTMGDLSKFAEACKIQGEVVEACEKVYGPDHFKTLVNIDRLGSLLLRHGRLLECDQHHKKALSGFVKLEERWRNASPTQTEHDQLIRKCRRQRLITKSHLGVVEGRYLRWENSKTLLEEALKGLVDLDPEDDEVTWVKEHLAFTCTELEDVTSRHRAYRLMLEVRETREKRLGKQHPFTLWAWFNLGRALWGIGEVEEALKQVERAREIAVTMLGTDHYGVLACEAVRGGLLIDNGHYDEAYEVLTSLDTKFEEITLRRGIKHLDRIVALRYQIYLFKLQQKYPEALAAGHRVLDLLTTINDEGRGKDHPLYSIIQKEIKEIEDKISGGATFEDSTTRLEASIRQRTVKSGIVRRS